MRWEGGGCGLLTLPLEPPRWFEHRCQTSIGKVVSCPKLCSGQRPSLTGTPGSWRTFSQKSEKCGRAMDVGCSSAENDCSTFVGLTTLVTAAVELGHTVLTLEETAARMASIEFR